MTETSPYLRIQFVLAYKIGRLETKETHNMIILVQQKFHRNNIHLIPSLLKSHTIEYLPTKSRDITERLLKHAIQFVMCRKRSEDYIAMLETCVPMSGAKRIFIALCTQL